MKTFAKVLGLLMLALLLVTVAVGASLYAGALHFDPAATISIDGEDLDISGAGIGHLLIAALAIVVALLIVFTVVPLALLGVLGVVVCALSVAALAVGGVALLLFSPLIFIGLLVWWIVRRARREGRTTMPA